MMFLQYAIWGVWSPILGMHLDHLHFTGAQMGPIFGTMAIASILSPFIAGQIADRYFSTERFLALTHFIGGLLLLWLAKLTTPTSVYWVMMAYALLYAPTVALTNSISFHHLSDAERDFGKIRLWGTIGWIAIGWVFGAALGHWSNAFSSALWVIGWLVTGFIVGVAAASRTGMTAGIVGAVLAGVLAVLLPRWWHGVQIAHCFTVGGITSIALAAYCLTLPHTPPAKKAANPWAFLEAIALIRQRNFAVLFFVSFFVATELAFYYLLSPIFFERVVRIPSSWVGPVMTIGQIAEVLVLILLPLSLKRIGMRNTIAIGISTWPVRYLIFSLFALTAPSVFASGPNTTIVYVATAIVFLAQALHGVCYAFFFVAGQVYTDQVATGDIRASAQSLIAIATAGVGGYVGAKFAGWARDAFTVATSTGLQPDFFKIYLIPVSITFACAIAFLIGFKSEKRVPVPEAA